MVFAWEIQTSKLFSLSSVITALATAWKARFDSSFMLPREGIRLVDVSGSATEPDMEVAIVRLVVTGMLAWVPRDSFSSRLKRSTVSLLFDVELALADGMLFFAFRLKYCLARNLLPESPAFGSTALRSLARIDWMR